MDEQVENMVTVAVRACSTMVVVVLVEPVFVVATRAVFESAVAVVVAAAAHINLDIIFFAALTIPLVNLPFVDKLVPVAAVGIVVAVVAAAAGFQAEYILHSRFQCIYPDFEGLAVLRSASGNLEAIPLSSSFDAWWQSVPRLHPWLNRPKRPKLIEFSDEKCA